MHGCPPDQDIAGQSLRLMGAGVIKMFSDVRSGRLRGRPGLPALLGYARTGNTLAVVRLDRLGRSLAELLATVTTLKERGITLLSLEERLDHHGPIWLAPRHGDHVQIRRGRPRCECFRCVA